MPLYEYLCAACGHRFERIQKFSDSPITDCPSCGGRVEKQISSPAIKFKGAGWYVNDYAKSGSTDRPAKSSKNEDSSKPAADAPKADTAKAEPAASKPAGTTESK